MPLNVNTWHHRGGMSGLGAVSPNQVYVEVDPVTGEQTPYVIGSDANGYPIILDPSSVAPWQAGLISQSLQTVSGLFGSRPYQGGYYGNSPGGAAVSAGVTPTGAGAGFSLSNNTLLIAAVVFAVFFLGKGRR